MTHTDQPAAADAAPAASIESPDTAPAAPPARPAWFPEKYYKDGGPADTEKLGLAYQELERAFHTKHPLSADLPKDAAGYSLRPEKLPEGMILPDEVLGKFQSVFHARGIGQAAASDIVGTFVRMEAENFNAATLAYQTKLAEDRAALAEKWGGEDAYLVRRHELAALVSEKLGADPADTTLFSNPRIVEFLANTHDYVQALEKQLGEDALATAKGSIAPGSAFIDHRTQAERIMRDPTHPDHAAYHAGDAVAVNKVMALLGARG